METNFDFESAFSYLLNPVEMTVENDKLPSLNYLGISTGASNLFFNISKKNLFEQDNGNNEFIPDSLTEEENSFNDLSSDLFQNGLPVPNQILVQNVSSGDIQEDDRTELELANELASIQSRHSSIAPKKRKTAKIERSPKQKKPAKRAKFSKETTGVGESKKRTNYCFDIRRVYCPYTKNEKLYCNVSLQGKLQETVDLVKGRRGKYAYTFYDQRKNKKERRYWPSQSCGQVTDDPCPCSDCKERTKIPATPVVPKRIHLVVKKREADEEPKPKPIEVKKAPKQEMAASSNGDMFQYSQEFPLVLPLPVPQMGSHFQDSQFYHGDIPSFDNFHSISSNQSPEDGNNVIFLDDVVLDM